MYNNKIMESSTIVGKDLESGVFLERQCSEDNQTQISAVSQNSSPHIFIWRRCILAGLVVFVGAIASVAFLALGIAGAHNTQKALFSERSSDICKAIKDSFQDFELFELWTLDASILSCAVKSDRVREFSRS